MGMTHYVSTNRGNADERELVDAEPFYDAAKPMHRYVRLAGEPLIPLVDDSAQPAKPRSTKVLVHEQLA
jgi:hypothetical protein